jgi:hypothetical protein
MVGPLSALTPSGYVIECKDGAVRHGMAETPSSLRPRLSQAPAECAPHAIAPVYRWADVERWLKLSIYSEGLEIMAKAKEIRPVSSRAAHTTNLSKGRRSRCHCRPCKTCGRLHYCAVSQHRVGSWVRTGGGCPPNRIKFAET